MSRMHRVAGVECGRRNRAIVAATLAEKFVTGSLALAVVFASLWAAPGVRGACGAALGLLMLGIAVIDARHFIIPDPLTATALGLALINAGIQGSEETVPAVLEAGVRGCLVAASFLLLRAVYSLLRGRLAIGLGDVKLAGVAGVWLGWTIIPIVLEFACLAGLGGYAARQLAGGRSMRMTEKIPFGLFFAPAIWLGWMVEVLLFTP